MGLFKRKENKKHLRERIKYLEGKIEQHDRLLESADKKLISIATAHAEVIRKLISMVQELKDGKVQSKS